MSDFKARYFDLFGDVYRFFEKYHELNDKDDVKNFLHALDALTAKYDEKKLAVDLLVAIMTEIDNPSMTGEGA